MPEPQIEPLIYADCGCWQMTYADYTAMVKQRNRGHDLIPNLTTLILGTVARSP